MDQVVSTLDGLGFFEAPASAKFHLCCKGGLLEHSLNVYEAAMFLREQVIQRKPELEEQLPLDSVAICALLHDTCKADIYKEGILSRKNADGYWEKYVGYQVDYNTGLPLGHGEKSVYIINGYMRLSREEAFAIRYHMGFAGTEDARSVGAAFEMYPLAFALSTADMEATYFIESAEDENQ